MGEKIILQERDEQIIREISRWRFLLGRQIRDLCGFTTQSACDRRLKKLLDFGYIRRERKLTEVASWYMVTKKAVAYYNLPFLTKQVRLALVKHDIAVVDVAISLSKKEGLDLSTITTERELKHQAEKEEFGTPRHYPDFVYEQDGLKYIIEIEISVKKKKEIETNVKANYHECDVQKWFVPPERVKIKANLEELQKMYGNVEIYDLREILKNE